MKLCNITGVKLLNRNLNDKIQLQNLE
jgi:hypothetical protein